MDNHAVQYYEFDCYRLDPHNRILLRDNEAVSLSPKLFEMLHILVKNSERAVSKNELMKMLWTDAIVEESNLAQNVFHLRKILGDQKGARYIQTVSKFGYRFIPEVNLIQREDEKLQSSSDLPKNLSIEPATEYKSLALPANSKTPKVTTGKKSNRRAYLSFIFILLLGFPVVFFWRLTRPAQTETINLPSKRSIAVMPFRGFVNDNSNEQFQMGMTDALINKLSNLHELSVRPTTAILKYAQTDIDSSQAGRELNVEAILNGTIQRSAGRIRVTVQLTRAQDGASLWAEKFDAAENDLFIVQDTISQQVSQALVTHLTANEKTQLAKATTDNMEAFDAYNKGRYFFNKRSFKEAVKYFQQATKKDSNYALAYSGLSDSYMLLIPASLGTSAAQNFRELAKSAARKATDLDNSLAAPHTSLGLITFEESGNWTTAEQEYLKAIEINPNLAHARHWHAWHLLINGRTDEAAEEMRKALELDPSSLAINLALGQIYYFSGQTQQSIDQLRKTLEFEPENDRVIFYYGLALAQAERYDEALAEMKRIPDLYERGGYESAGTGKAGMAYVLACSGRNDEARRILNNLEKVKEPANLLSYEKAIIYLRLGEREKALALLEKAILKDNYVYVIRLKFDPRLASLRDDPNFVNLLRRAGIS